MHVFNQIRQMIQRWMTQAKPWWEQAIWLSNTAYMQAKLFGGIKHGFAIVNQQGGIGFKKLLLL